MTDSIAPGRDVFQVATDSGEYRLWLPEAKTDHIQRFIAPPEDHIALADAIEAIATDAKLFQDMSRAASERVRQQSGRELVLSQELDLIQGNVE